MVYYVYVLRNSLTGILCIGSTPDLKHRTIQHKKGESKFTRKAKKQGEWKLIYFEEYPDKEEAIKREKFLKGGSGHKYLKKQLSNYFSEYKKE